MNRIKIIDIHVNQINLESTVEYIQRYDFSIPGYICLPDMSVFANALKDNTLKNILNNSKLTLADGKPLEIIAKLKGQKNISTISGYWLIKKLMVPEIKHFFYGPTKNTNLKVITNLKLEFPACNIVGSITPPFVELNQIENNKKIIENIDYINSKKPDIIWVGVSSPKQDYIMHYFHKHLNQGLMIGVGGVLDYLSGTHKISPEWIKMIGLRWLYRLCQEPKRLWKKYFNTVLIIIQYFFHKYIFLRK